MAVPKICGIETEYGVVSNGAADSNPISASSLLVNSYVQHIKQRISWDFEDETPGNDARDGYRPNASPPQVESHLANAVLTNGARFYVDHAHPEYSSPECRTALSATLYDKAGEAVLRASMDAARAALANTGDVIVYKNNSDGKGNSYGCHENYLVDRAVPFETIVRQILPFFVTRQVIVGAGKVGSEGPGMTSYDANPDITFQLSQRADFMEETVGLETTMKRPIVNTRDEPHADAKRFRRLHVIVGDANMSEFATFLKLGMTAVMLAMIEDGYLDGLHFVLQSPVQAIRMVSRDLSMTKSIELVDGTNMTALEMQWQYLAQAKKYAENEGLSALGDEQLGRLLIDEWEGVLRDIETDMMLLVDRLDWVAKYQLINGYREKHGLSWGDPKLKAMDFQYHDLRPAKSLFSRLPMRTLCDQSAVNQAVTEPPSDTRAYFRGRCLQKWGDHIVAANWDSIVLDTGKSALRRIPMADPLRGTAELVDELLDRCETPTDLVKALGA